MCSTFTCSMVDLPGGQANCGDAQRGHLSAIGGNFRGEGEKVEVVLEDDGY